MMLMFTTALTVLLVNQINTYPLPVIENTGNNCGNDCKVQNQLPLLSKDIQDLQSSKAQDTQIVHSPLIKRSTDDQRLDDDSIRLADEGIYRGDCTDGDCFLREVFNSKKSRNELSADTFDNKDHLFDVESLYEKRNNGDSEYSEEEQQNVDEDDIGDMEHNSIATAPPVALNKPEDIELLKDAHHPEYVKVASQDVKAPVPIVSHHLQHNIKEDELDKGKSTTGIKTERTDRSKASAVGDKDFIKAKKMKKEQVKGKVSKKKENKDDEVMADAEAANFFPKAGLPAAPAQAVKVKDADIVAVAAKQKVEASGLEEDVSEVENNDHEHDKTKETPHNEEEKYKHKFSDDPERDIPWHEPMMDENCWAHSMLSTEYQFAPNCNTDGSYGPKQCFLERCWCVKKDGNPYYIDFKMRFHYKLSGIALECKQ